MQAIALQLKAFGPYNEEQDIRFEELRNESIFLITGPTGAGKTTIFDAICYALYGKASGSDREQDTLRSHFATDSTQTEVRYTFGLKEKKYLVVRTPRQRKMKERGEGFTENPARAELYEVTGGETVLLSAKVKDVNDMLEARLGLDYEQFRKMIMIPQGEFRKLISENSKEREEILQKIFRTHFYEQITEELKMQAKELKGSIQDLDRQIEQEQAKIEWTEEVPQEDDGRVQIADKLSHEISRASRLKNETKFRLDKARDRYKELQEAYFSGKQLKEKFEERDRLAEAAEELASKKTEMTELNKRLQRAERSEQVKPYEEQVNKRHGEWQQAHRKFLNHQQELQNKEKQYQEFQAVYEKEKQKESDREKVKVQIENLKKQLQNVKEYNLLENQTKEAEKKKTTLESKINQLRNNIKSDTERLAELDKQRDKRESLLSAYYQAENEEKQMIESLQKISKFRRERDDLLRKREDFLQIKTKYQKVQKQTDEAMKKVRELEEERKKNHAILLAEQLRQEEACPVCGSVHHPQPASGISSSVSDEELTKWTEVKTKLEAELQVHKDKYQEIEADGKYQRQLVKQLAEEAGIDQDMQDEWQSVYTTVDEKRRRAGTQKADTTAKLETLNRITQERTDIKERLEERNSKLDEALNQKETTDAEWNRSLARLEELQKNIPKSRQDESSMTAELRTQEIHYNELLQKWETVQEQLQVGKETYQQSVTVHEQLKDFKQSSGEKYHQEKAVLMEKLQQAGFASLDDYQEAVMEKEAKKQLEEVKSNYDSRKDAVETRYREISNEIKDKQIPVLKTLEEDLKNQDKFIQETGEELQEYQLYIKQHQQIADTMAGLLAMYQSSSEQYYDIGELADLAKGENHLRLSFERYVLASFLDEILLQANIRLDQLTEHRYQLVRSNEVAKRGAQSGLDLEVLDHHTGQKRSVKTLSGGEGFKAALSLALGMADVVQAHAGGVQLETLFIDEGFGTLDDLSLEQAIDCLKGLQQGNRVLGIISHVPQLKEEIPAKLQVTLTEKGSRAEFIYR